MNNLRYFLIWCSGADIEILKDLKIEQKRFAVVGLSIFSSTLIAFLASSWAFSEIFEQSVSQVIVGIIWGILVFTLNRTFIQAFDTLKLSKGFGNIIIKTFPIILVSVLTSSILSYPLIFRLFNENIDAEQTNIIQREFETLSKIENSKLDRQLQDYELKIKEEEKKLVEIQKQITTDKKNNGEFTKALLAVLINNILNEEKVQRARISSLEIEYNKLSIDIQKQKTQNREYYLTQITKSNSGIIGKIRALNSLSEKQSSIFFIRYLIILSFLIIELLPLFSRMLLISSNYEKQLQIQNDIQFKKTLKNKENTKSGNEIESLRYFGFEDLFIQILNNANRNLNDNSKKANNLLYLGIGIIVVGLLLYFVWILTWVNIFEKNNFKSQQLYGLLAGSILFIFVEMLGGWFLRQYKYTLEKSHFTLKLKTILERQFLTHLYVNELDKKTSKIEESKEKVIEMLKQDIQFPELLSDVNSSFMKEAFDTLSTLSETVKKVATNGK